MSWSSPGRVSSESLLSLLAASYVLSPGPHAQDADSLHHAVNAAGSQSGPPHPFPVVKSSQREKQINLKHFKIKILCVPNFLPLLDFRLITHFFRVFFFFILMPALLGFAHSFLPNCWVYLYYHMIPIKCPVCFVQVVLVGRFLRCWKTM